MFKIFKVIKELRIYRDYLKIIKKESTDSPVWSRRRLRRDWIGRIYTVVNLPPEDIFSPDVPKDARPSFVMGEIKPINDYLQSLNLQEIITLSFVPIKENDEDSYLVVYQFVFRHLSWMWILSFIVQTSLLVAGIVYLAKII